MLNGKVVKSGEFKGCINFGVVQPDSREARLYPIADEMYVALMALEAEVQRIKSLSQTVRDNLDDAVLVQARELLNQVKG